VSTQDWVDHVAEFAPSAPERLKDYKNDALLLPDIDVAQGDSFTVLPATNLQTAGSEITLMLSAFVDESLQSLDELTLQEFNKIIEAGIGKEPNASFKFMLDVENGLRERSKKEPLPDVAALASPEYQPLYIWPLMMNLSKTTAALSPTEMEPSL
jgi:hypothetical protein